MHNGRDGYLWATTLDGLVRFDGFRFTVFDRSNAEGIGSNRFTPLLETPDGAFWLGTENGGVTRYAQGRFTTFTTRDGLPSNAVSGITADDQGQLWATQRRPHRRMERREFEPHGDRVAAIRRLGVVARSLLGHGRRQALPLFARRAEGT